MLVSLKCQLPGGQSLVSSVMYTWSREGGLLPENSFQDSSGEFTFDAGAFFMTIGKNASLLHYTLYCIHMKYIHSC